MNEINGEEVLRRELSAASADMGMSVPGPETAAAVDPDMHGPGGGRRASGGPGKRSRTDGMTRPPVQALGGLVQRHAAQPSAGSATEIREVAQDGVRGSGGALPHGDTIQQSFGRHDIGGIGAHVGGAAAAASESMGAEAYATGSSIAFRQSPDLHTAAHEAAHVVQQRGGVGLADGVGSAGDRHEQHADAVADRVVRGESAEDLLGQYGGGGGGGGDQVQGLASCDCGGCAICKAREKSGAASAPAATPGKSTAVQAMLSDAPVQMDLLTDAKNLVTSTVTAVGNWIDLLGPKRDLMNKIIDPAWIIGAVSTALGNDASPKHKMLLDLRLVGAGVSAGLAAMAFANRIAGCNSRAAVTALDVDFTAWKVGRIAAFPVELEAIIEEYREVERGWLRTFGAAGPIVKDPATPNKGGQPVSISFDPAVPSSVVTVETRVNCTYGLTAAAQADNNGDGAPDVAAWTPDEQTHFMTQFQRQLNDVWSTGAGAVAPFRASGPANHLLASETPKWSDLTATMAARVTASAASPHFNLNVFKEAPGESNRAFVGGGGTGTFYLANADKGYHRTGPQTGDRNEAEQPTLAHEWHHMLGNPDEYAENSAAQSASSTTPATRSGDNAACLAYFNTIIADPASTPAQVAQAQADLAALRNHATDMDAATPGFQSGIFPLAGRTDIPDQCFAIRGSWAAGPNHLRLRPGAQSQRGGTNISQSAADAARLSDRGSEVRPYMREGIVEELRTMLPGRFNPEVSFDHNFADMTPAAVVETLTARIQNIFHDVALGAANAPAPAPGDTVPAGPHDHGHDGDDDHHA